jgi:biopolymer transport protein ExbD
MSDVHHPPHDEAADEEYLEWRRRRRKKGGGHALPGQDITALNLTPLMDIMTILLVFLIQSLANEPNNINTSIVRPPPSSAKDPIENATRVTIGPVDVLVDDTVVFATADILAKGKDEEVPEIRDALTKAKELIEANADILGNKFEGKLLVVADEKTEYRAISSVLISAGKAQFSEYELVVLPKEGKAR